MIKPIKISVDSRTSKAITKVLIRLGILEEGKHIKVKRCYPGRHQLDAGAWRVVFLTSDGREWGGSVFTCRDILQAERLSFYQTPWGDYEVFVEVPGV